MTAHTDPMGSPHLEERGGSAGIDEDKMSETRTKRCPKCGVTKTVDQFAIDRARKDGKKSWCRSCTNEYYLHLRGDRTGGGYWMMRESNWKQYGITLFDGSPFLRADYNRLSNLQRGVCALCGRHPPMWSETLSVDHDKKTGRVRGLLCTDCNHKAVGTFERCGRFTTRKDVNELIRAYLENPPASRLPARAEAEPEPLPETPVYSVITSPPKSAISWISAWTYTSTPVKETQA